MQLPVEALRQHTGVLTFRYGTRVGAPKRLKISGLMVHKEDSHTRTKRKPVVEKVPEEDHDVHPLSPSEDGGVGMHLEKLLLFLLSVSALGILYIAYKHIK